MQFLSRRDFMKGTAALAAAAAAFPETPVLAAQAGQNNQGGANERLNVAVIGIRGRGGDHISGFAGRNNCVITHLCDADSSTAAGPIKTVEGRQKIRPEFVQDLRRIMDNKNIHIVSIATPNHWHALAAIWAIQAGKDVYVEKPVSHNVSEGRRIVEAARRHNKIVQTGTQIRSSQGVQQAIEFLRSGKLGKLQVARGLCYKTRNSIGRVDGEQPIPKSVNYDLWCGPAQRLPLRRQRLHYDWHWTWEYGNGDLGNQGIHQVDVARWGLGKNELCTSVVSCGGRFGYVDDGETANTQIAHFEYGDADLIFEVRGRATKPYRGAGVGNVFHCTDGYLVMPGYSNAIAYSPDGKELQRFTGARDHYTNFVEAVRNRRREHLTADILEGHLSSALCHLANISYRLGRPTPFNGSTKTFGDDAAMAETFERMREHLSDNQIPLDKTSYMMGRRLTLDPKTETFANDAEANRMLTREYRKGFEVPARI